MNLNGSYHLIFPLKFGDLFVIAFSISKVAPRRSFRTLGPNRVIGRVLHELKLIERWGSGIPRIIETCKEFRLQSPVFEEIGTHFKVTIFTLKVEQPIFDKTDQDILDLLSNTTGLSTRQIADSIGFSTRAIRTRLITLIKKGSIIEIASGPNDPNKKYFLKRCN